jgi:hypothetical protein
MPHVGYSTSLVADGVDLTRSDGRIIGRVVRGLNELPEVRGKDTIVPGMNGRIARNRKLDRLIIEWEGLIQGAGSTEDAKREDFRDLIDSIRSLMNPVQDPYELVVTLEDGSTRSITARPINAMFEAEFVPSYREASLEWESVDSADWGVAGS